MTLGTKGSSRFVDTVNQVSLERNQSQSEIESASAAPGDARSKSATNVAGRMSATQVALETSKDIYGNIKERGYHNKKDEKVIYSKLMHHLDHLEKKNWIWNAVMAAEIIVFSGLTAFLVCSLHVESIDHRRRLGLRWWQYITMAMMLFSGVSVVRFVTFIASWPFNWYWRVQKYVVYFVRQLKRCVDVTIWFCVVLLGWFLWFRPRLKHVNGDVSIIATRQVTRLLIALCLGSFLWLLKNALYLKLEADLHYHQLFDRIKQSVVYLNGIVILDPEYHKTDEIFLFYNQKQKPEDSKDEVIKNIWMDVLAMRKNSVPIWILRRLSEEYLNEMKDHKPKDADELLKDDDKLLAKAKGLFNKITNKKIDQETDQFGEIERQHLCQYGLSKAELDFLFKPKPDEEPDKNKTPGEAFPDKTISHDEFLNWAVRAHKNSWGLEHILTSSKRALVKLNRLMSTFLVAIVLIIWLLLSGIVNTAQVALLFAPFLAASFVFENSLKNVFRGLIFVFAMHPFDVGDRVIIDNAQMRVKELSILTSVFFKYDTGAEVTYPNSKLATTRIVNLDITPDQSDKLDFVVNADTPPEDVKDLELKIQKLLDDDVKYSSGTKVVKSTECAFNKTEPLKMTVHFKYLVSYLTAQKKAVCKSAILSDIIRFRKEMEANKKEYPHGHEPYYLELITLPKKVRLQQIEEIKSEIMSGDSVVKKHYAHSKVVMTALDDNQITMALYVRKTEYKQEDDHTEIKTQEVSKSDDKMSPDEEQEYFKDVFSGLKYKEYVSRLKVEKDGEKIYENLWDRFQASIRGEGDRNRTVQSTQTNAGVVDSTGAMEQEEHKATCFACTWC